MKKNIKPVNFESAMIDLESLIDRMEKDDLSLDASLADFEKGIALIRVCQSSLNNAEQRIKILGEDLDNDFLENDNKD